MSIKQSSIDTYKRSLNKYMKIMNYETMGEILTPFYGKKSKEYLTELRNEMKNSLHLLDNSPFSNPSSFKIFLSALSNLDLFIDLSINTKKNIKFVIEPLIVDLFKVIEEKNSKNIVDDRDKEKLMNWNEIMEKAEEFNNSPLSSDVEKLIISLYYLSAPRRLEYADLIYVSNLYPFDDLQTKNYLTVKIDSDGEPIFDIVLNDFKTVEHYGAYYRTIDKNERIHKYFKHWWNNLKETDKNSEKEFPVLNMTRDKLGKTLISLSNKFLIKPINLNMLRHNFINWFLSKPRSLIQKTYVAWEMGHNIITQQEYVKLKNPTDLNPLE